MEDLGMKSIRFTINIHAAKEKVWATLWQDATFQDWAHFIDEGLYIKGVLREGDEIQFMSAVNGYGVTSLVEQYRANEFVRFRHKADTKNNGADIRENEWTGGSESYSLQSINGITELIVETDIPYEQEELFKINFPKALARLKTLAEANK